MVDMMKLDAPQGTFTISAISISRKTVAAGDAQTVIRHMMARQERDPEFFFRYLVDQEGHLKGLFWADSQSRRDYDAFGDVVVFDSTYNFATTIQLYRINELHKC
jgi:hypothetical protein